MLSMLIQAAIKEVKRRKLRSTATILGYVFGIAFLLIIVTFAEGYNLVAAGELNRIGTHFVVYIPSSRSCPCEDAEVGPFFRDTYTPTFDLTLVDKVKSLDGVADAAPCLSFRLNDLTISGVNFDSLATQTNVVSSAMLVSGNYSKIYDPGAVLVDSVFASISDIAVGDTISAFDRDFTVAGIVNPRMYSRPAGIADFYAPLEVVQEIARSYGEIHNFGVKDVNVVLVEISSEGDSSFIDSVERSVLQTVESYGILPGAIVGYRCGVAARKVIPITESSAWAISAVLLFSVIFFAVKSQFASVVERTREIGVLKAIGWTDFEVVKQVFYESLILGLVGGIAGLSVGLLTTFLIPQFGLVPTQYLVLSVSPLLIVLGLSLAVVGGTVAGVASSWRAARMQPADALRRF